MSGILLWDFVEEVNSDVEYRTEIKEKAKREIGLISEQFVEHDDKIYKEIMPAANKILELDSSVFHNFPRTGPSRKLRRTTGMETFKLPVGMPDPENITNGDSEAMASLLGKIAKVEK